MNVPRCPDEPWLMREAKECGWTYLGRKDAGMWVEYQFQRDSKDSTALVDTVTTKLGDRVEIALAKQYAADRPHT